MKRSNLSNNKKTPQEIIHINNEAEDEDVQFLAELERENLALERELKAFYDQNETRSSIK